jgi:hypothetical protein
MGRKFPCMMLLLVLCGSLPFVSALSAEPGWISLFNGNNLDDWRAGENASSFRVENGLLVADGPRAHLFYAGAVNNADFRNFELKAEVLTQPGCNSGIYFHTRFQESNWPEEGFEVQIDNSATGEGGYLERKLTGSLYGVRNVYKALAQDGSWFEMHITVHGKQVQVRLGGVLLVDYIEPEPVAVDPAHPHRVLGHGTFALQCHDAKSKVSFRNLWVRPLPDAASAAAPTPPAFDAVDQQILHLGMANFPMVDYHIHLKGGLTLEQALAESRRTGVFYGIAPNCGLGFPIQNDAGIEAYMESMKGAPVWLGMQAEGREWTQLFSREAVSRFDYVFTDAMTFRDEQGKRTRLWIKEEVNVPDKQAFMEMYVKRILGVLNREPIDIYVNPTFLPECIAAEYDQLWTPERMQQVIEAAKKNQVAIEINNRYRLPSPAFIRMAKAAGVKFSFGTNNGDRNLGRLEYALEMVRQCGLGWEDIFVPAPVGQRAIDRKPLPK